MNTNTRNTYLSDAAREVMRPMALGIAQKLLMGNLYGTAVVLYGAAVKVVVRDEDIPEDLPDGWEAYFQDCLDLLQSYEIFKTDTPLAWKQVEQSMGLNSITIVRALLHFETMFTAIKVRIRK